MFLDITEYPNCSFLIKIVFAVASLNSALSGLYSLMFLFSK